LVEKPDGGASSSRRWWLSTQAMLAETALAVTIQRPVTLMPAYPERSWSDDLNDAAAMRTSLERTIVLVDRGSWSTTSWTQPCSAARAGLARAARTGRRLLPSWISPAYTNLTEGRGDRIMQASNASGQEACFDLGFCCAPEGFEPHPPDP
jgi:hypothetical protein